MSNLLPDQFDYIICGGGTAGCVLAARLAEYEVNVLLVEAGVDNNELPATRIPAGSPQIAGTEHDWNLVSEPGRGINGRQVNLTQGKFLGGNSGMNGTLCFRGMMQDYDDWGIPGWSGKDFFAYMQQYYTAASFPADEKAHGTEGLLHTSADDLAPISELLLESFQSKGLPLHHDMFSSGTTPNGCGHVVRTVWNGMRTSAADFLGNPKRVGNLTVLTNTLVERILTEQTNGATRAVGVDTRSKAGEKRVFRAQKEVIVSAGAYASPTILLRSGIGPKQDVEAHGISSIVDLPGVGRNLQDHAIVYMFYELNEPNLTLDHLLWHGNAQENMAKASAQWAQDKSGALAKFPFGAFAFARLDDRLADNRLWGDKSTGDRDAMGQAANQPNVEFFNTECYLRMDADAPVAGQSVLGMIPQLFSPRSRGYVTLRSADPTVGPVIDHKFLEDPLDALVLAEACSLANEIVMEGSGTKDVIKGSWPANLEFHKVKERGNWESIAKQHVTTGYHPSGTCKMGLTSDPLTVVDEKLRVRRVVGLRVVDNSIMPKIPCGHTQMMAFGIAEKTADMIMNEVE